jgi:PKD repeat protein
MKRYLLGITFAILLGIGSFQTLQAQTVITAFCDGQVYWRVKDGFQPMLTDSILQVYQVRGMEFPFLPLNPKKLEGKEIIAQLHRTVRLKFDNIQLVFDFLTYLRSLSITDHAEMVPLAQTSFTPNDPQFPSQWNLAQIGAANAWNLSLGNPLVRVAVVDDAVLVSHQDLAPSIWVNPLENPNNALDDDGNGYVNDVSGWDAADNDNNPAPPLAFATSSVFTHGTHCAGIVGAATNNGIGIASIGAGLKIIPVKCNNDATPGPTLPAAYDGVTYAITLQPEVMSLSWGGPGYAATNQLLFDLAFANDIVVVAAAGNSNVATPMYPASYNHVISVAATDPSDLKASFSNYGATIDVSAPGVNILSTLAGNTSDYGQMSGTSMACPLTAGLCGLMRSFNPAKTATQIEACLESTADPIDALNPGYVGQLGSGRINAFNALQCVSGTPIAAFTQNPTNVCPGFAVQFTDQSYGSPTSWSWTFPGGTPGTSTLQNPLITYNTPGTYSVTLTVSNLAGTDTYTFNSIVVALPTATMSGGGLVNQGSPAIITVTFTGAPPFDFTYFNGVSNVVVNNVLTNSYSFAVTPSVTTTYSLVSMNNAQCTGTVSGSANVIVSTGCGAQVTFQQILGGSLMDNPYVIKQTPDCGYIVGGNTFSYGTGSWDAVLAKLNQFGELLWFKTYGDASDASTFNDIIPVANGFVCLGNRGVNNQGRLYIVKTDFNGVFQWHQHIEYISGGGAVFTGPGEVIEMPNGDLTISYSGAHTNFNSMGQGFARLNGLNGAILWARNAQFNNFEGCLGLTTTSTGNVIATGSSRSTGVAAGLYDFLLTERDGSGNLIWSKNYGGVANDFGQDLVRLPDNGYLVVGYTQGFSSSVSDIMIMRTNSAGVITWTKTYARPAADVAVKIVAGCNGKYFVAGSSRTAGAGNDALLFQIDLNGNVLWAKAIGGVLDDGDVVSLGRTGDCGCIMSTSTISYGVGEFDYLVMKTDSLGTMSCHATPVSLTVTNITPSTFTAGITNGNSPTTPSYATTVLAHNPSVPDSVCDACGTPVADFDYITNVLSLACIDNSVNGQQWSWNFGDGSPLDTLQNAVHEYVGPGTYTVTLIVSSACGSDTIAKTVTITGLNECMHVMQPGPVKGFDTDAFSRDDATNSNYGSSAYYGLYTWTWSGNPGTGRSYVKFDLSKICTTATLLDGRLSTWYDVSIGQTHSGANDAWLSRCTSLWDEYAVTWLNQPTTTAINQIAVPQFAGTTNMANLAVTPLVQAMIAGPNYGFQWRHQVEATYRRTIWNASDHYDPAFRPKLTLKFNPIFAYATALPSGSHSVVLCPGDSVQLNLAGYLNASTTTGPSTATGYLWVPSAGLSCSTCANPWAHPDSTTTYRAVAYNCPSCADIDTIRVTVSQVWVDAPDQILCAGDSIQMQAFHPIPGTSFLWTPTTTLSPANVQYPWAYPTTPTWYYVTATDAINGCVSEDSALVLTGYPSSLPPLIPDTSIICNQGTITFPLNPNFTPIGNDFYEWNLIGNITPDANSPSSDAIINTNIYPATYHYVLTVTNEFGCVTQDSVDVLIDCAILPTDRISFTGESIDAGNRLHWQTEAGYAPDHFVLERSADGLAFSELSAQAGRAATSDPLDYQYLDAQPLIGDNFYRLQVVDANGQSRYTETILLNKGLDASIAIYPNPTQGKVTLSSSAPFEDASLRVWNVMGQQILRVDALKGKAVSIDLSHQARGAYMVELRTGKEVSWMKVMVE